MLVFCMICILLLTPCLSILSSLLTTGVPSDSLYLSSTLPDTYGNDVILRNNDDAAPLGRSVWIDKSPPLPGNGRLEVFYVYIHGDPKLTQLTVVTSMYPLMLQIWRPDSGTVDAFSLVWQQQIEVAYPTERGRLYTVKVGNTNSGSDFYTQQNDAIGFMLIDNINLVSYDNTSSSNKSWFYDVKSSSQLDIGANFTFQSSSNLFSVAVKVIQNPALFVNRTLTTDGCGCRVAFTLNTDCACCVSYPNDCQCPGVTSPPKCTTCDNIATCPSDYVCDVVTLEGCFQEISQALPLAEAAAFCTTMPDTLFGNIYDENIYTEVSSIAAQQQHELVWTGAYVASYDWQWVVIGKLFPFEVQGCFTPTNAITLLPTSIGQQTTADDCIRECQNRNYVYAAVDPHSTGSGVKCYCGDSFDFSSASEVNLTQCRCEDDLQEWCGGENTQALLHTDGKTYTNFVGDFPANHHCAAIDTSIPGWIKADCLQSVSYGHVCEYPGISDAQCTTVSGSDKLQVNGRCITIHLTNNTWYQAQRHCLSMDAHLVKVDHMNTDTNLLTVLLSQGRNLWWIGATNRAFVWNSHSITNPVPVFKSEWGTNEPDLTHDCAVMSQAHGYNWITVNCSQMAHFYCMKDHNNCEPDLCENGGICTDDHNDYDCACLPGWKGKRCDQADNSPQSSSPPPSGLPSPTGTDSGGSGLKEGAIIGISVGVVVAVLLVAAIIVGVLCYRSKKMEKELKLMKTSANGSNIIVDADSHTGLTRQDSVYEQIDDNYQRMDGQVNTGAAYYKGLDSYQGLGDRPAPAPVQYQDLSNYQGLAPGARADSAPTTPYQTLPGGDPNYQGLHGPRETAPTPYVDLRSTAGADKPPELPTRPLVDEEETPPSSQGKDNDNIVSETPAAPEDLYLHVIGSEDGGAYKYADSSNYAKSGSDGASGEEVATAL